MSGLTELQAGLTEIDIIGSSGGPFLPLAGGTMLGDIIFNTGQPDILTSFDNVIVVDPAGNGDHATVGAAMAVALAGDIIWVFGTTTETGNVAHVAGTVLYGTPNSVVGMGANQYQILSGGTLIGVNITNSGVGAAVGIDSSTVLLDSCTVTSTVALFGTDVSSDPNLTMYNCKITGVNVGINFSAALSTSLFLYNRFNGPITAGARSNAAWSNAPFHYCEFTGGRVNVSFANGNNSNTDNGVSVNTPATAAYTRNAVVVEDRTLLASASATITNNNNVLAALIADLQAQGILT